MVAGTRMRLIKWRFTPEMQEVIRNSKWWERSVEDCARYIDFMSGPLGENGSTHPLLKRTQLKFFGNANS